MCTLRTHCIISQWRSAACLCHCTMVHCVVMPSFSPVPPVMDFGWISRLLQGLNLSLQPLVGLGQFIWGDKVLEVRLLGQRVKASVRWSDTAE